MLGGFPLIVFLLLNGLLTSFDLPVPKLLGVGIYGDTISLQVALFCVGELSFTVCQQMIFFNVKECVWFLFVAYVFMLMNRLIMS